MYLKMSTAKWQPYCPGREELKSLHAWSFLLPSGPVVASLSIFVKLATAQAARFRCPIFTSIFHYDRTQPERDANLRDHKKNHPQSTEKRPRTPKTDHEKGKRLQHPKQGEKRTLTRNPDPRTSTKLVRITGKQENGECVPLSPTNTK